MTYKNYPASRDIVPENNKQTEQQEANTSDSRDMGIQSLLHQRAKERAAPLKWNIHSVIFSYSLLAAVIIMSLRGVDLLITILTAALGLGALGLSSWLRIRKFEHMFYQEEAENYAKLTSGESTEESTEAGSDNLAHSVESPLTDRETAVLEQMAKGASSKAIADALEISPQTVKNHISHVFFKLGVTDRTSAVLVGLRHGWIKDNHKKL